MNSQKICPHCKKSFEGRRNQVYCTSLCKQRAFHEGKTAPSSTKQSLSAGPTQKARATHQPKLNRDPSINIETLKVEAAERMKRLEMEQRQSERKYEMKREDRQFKKERERTKWEYEALQLQVAKLDREHSKQEIARQEQKDIESPSEPPEQAEEEESSGWKIGALVLGIAGGIIVATMKSIKPPQPAKLPIPDLDLESLDGISAMLKRSRNGL